MTVADLQPGRVFWLGPDAGIQWRIRPIALRLIRAHEANWDANAYLDGYELDGLGYAISRRTCLVTDIAGLIVVHTAAELARHMGVVLPDSIAAHRKVRNRGPIAIPRQRTSTTVRSTR